MVKLCVFYKSGIDFFNYTFKKIVVLQDVNAFAEENFTCKYWINNVFKHEKGTGDHEVHEITIHWTATPVILFISFRHLCVFRFPFNP